MTITFSNMTITFTNVSSPEEAYARLKDCLQGNGQGAYFTTDTYSRSDEEDGVEHDTATLNNL